MLKRLMPDTPIWEKLVGIVGLVIILLTISSLVNSALRKNGDSPVFVFEVMETTQISNGYLVHVEVTNTGDLTAESIELGAHLKLPEGEDERVSVSVEYFVPGVVQEFRFYFSQDPALGELSFYPLSFHIP